MNWMAQIGAGCWDCWDCGCTAASGAPAPPGCPEGAVSDDPEATCTADQLAACQAGYAEGGICTTDAGDCKTFADVPCAGGWGITAALPAFADQGVIPADFASTETVCNSPAALYCVSPESGCAACGSCGVNATGNFGCGEDSTCGSNCQQCVPMIGCLNCANPEDASRTV